MLPHHPNIGPGKAIVGLVLNPKNSHTSADRAHWSVSNGKILLPNSKIDCHGIMAPPSVG